MSNNGSDIGSEKQQPVKRNLSPTKECNAVESLASTTENVGPPLKKKFMPTIPPRRAKQTIDSQLLSERKPIQPYRGIPGRENRGRGRCGIEGVGGPSNNYTRGGAQQGYQPRPEYRPSAPWEQPKFPRPEYRPSAPWEQPKLSRPEYRPTAPWEQPKLPRPEYRPPAPWEQPILIQTEGTLFGQGVGVITGTEKKRGPRSIPTKIGFDPVMNALNAVDKYEDLQNNNLYSKMVLMNQDLTLSTAVKENELHHQMDKFILKRGSLIKNEDLVTVNQKMFENLKYHQIEGIKFMWNACFTTNSTAGCVLAHCMGLGKSLQVVTLAHTVLMNAICEVNRVLVVCPLSTVFNWENEFKIWLPGGSFVSLNICEIASCKTNKAREEKMKKWMDFGGVLIIGYEMFRTLTKEKKKRSEQDLLFLRALVDPGPDLLVCDEGHLLKNEDSEIYKAMNQICTRRRIMLTGTPLQNNLFEFFTMVQFVSPGLLGTKVEFSKNFAKVLEKGQAVDSTKSDVRAMKRRALILHKMLENTVQRFDSNVLAPFLPPKFEYVVSVRMSELQIKLYVYYLENLTKGGSIQPLETRVESAGLFSDYQQLSRVCTHPKALLLASNRRDLKNRPGGSKKGKNLKNDEDDISWANEPEMEEDVCLKEAEDPASSNPWWSNLVSDDDISSIEHSGKLLLLMDILGQCELIGDKLLVFSQSLTSLDLIEEFLAIEDLKNQARSVDNTSKGFNGTWSINTDYFRLDGSTSSEQRLKWCKSFNDPQNPRARLFLISTRAGGIGINLIGANRAIIFDASWNPSQDLQSVFRVYRMGQKKPCYVYRFVAQGTMEEKVYYRQVAKLSLSRRIVDEEQMDRYFASNDLTDLYTFNADGQLRLPDSVIGHENSLHPNDKLLSELAVRMKKWVGAFREHDSMLQNRPEEYLDNTEREAIWKIFEEAKETSQEIQN